MEWITPRIEKNISEFIEKGYSDKIAVRMAAIGYVMEKLKFNPYPHQLEAIRATYSGAKMLAFNWFRQGSGKTTICSIDHASLLGIDEKTVNGEGLISTNYAPFSLNADVMYRRIYNLIVDQNIFKIKNLKDVRKSKIFRYLTTPNGNNFYSRTCENPTGLLGESNSGMISLDEYARIEDEVYTQHISPTADVYDPPTKFISTPQGIDNDFFTKCQFFHDQMKLGNKKYFYSKVTIWDTLKYPHAPYTYDQIVEKKKNYILSARDPARAEMLWKQEYECEFIGISGAVFKNYRPDINGVPFHVQNVKYNPNYPIDIACDAGFTNKFACLFTQYIDDQLFILKEIYKEGVTNSQKVRLVGACLNLIIDPKIQYPLDIRGYPDVYDDGMNVIPISECLKNVRLIFDGYYDPEDPDMQAEFSNAGFPISNMLGMGNPINARRKGYDGMIHMFDYSQYPKIVIDKSCENLQREIRTLVRDENGEIPQKPKTGDHAISACRYNIVGKVIRPIEPSVIWFKL